MMPAFQDITGKRFGRLIAVERVVPDKGRAKWLCGCDCGKTTLISISKLNSGSNTSCGCRKHIRDTRFQDISGQRFGMLLVVERAESRETKTWWKCQCDCGKLKEISASHLKKGNTKSCGCNIGNAIRAAQTKHGCSKNKTPEYTSWVAMTSRVFDPNTAYFKHYGGRGITRCERWSSFENFLEDMGLKPSPKHSLERKNNELGYSPENCCWATPKEQAANTRNTVRTTYKGETKCIREWSELTGLNYGTLHSRIKRGWPIDRAIETPILKRRVKP